MTPAPALQKFSDVDKQESKVEEYHFNEAHRLSHTNPPKHIMLEAYKQWVITYDNDHADGRYVGPSIITSKLLQYYSGEGVVNFLDVACGTGLSGLPFKKAVVERGINARLVGVDFSRAMLDEAVKKNIYDEVAEADVKEAHTLPKAEFDLLMASGLFMSGHIDAKYLPNLTECLVPGGVGAISVRQATFEAEKEQYMKAIKASGCELLEYFLGEYTGPIKAYYFILKKSVSR